MLLISTIKSLWKTHEIHKNKIPFKYFIYVPIGQRNFDKQKIYNFKRTLETRFKFDLSKIHHYHLVRVSQKKIHI